MAQYSARKADDRVINQFHKTRVHHPQHSLAIEILTVYRVGNLGREEPVGYFLRRVHSQ